MVRARYLFMMLMTVFAGYELSATHNRAGEITYEQIGPLTIRATITTYTRTASFGADRDSLEMVWGDGVIESIRRSNGNGEELPNDIKVNYYTAEHTYPTRGTYTMSMTDPNRIAGILNIDFPNSVNIQFYLATTFTLLDPRFQGRNNSAILLQPPIDYACIGQIFTHNPNAYDPDGDSLSYQLITPFQASGIVVPNYELPDRIRPGADNIARLDPITGDFVWNAPQIQGEFNITYLINEYRQGVLINSIIRDMQILVRLCPDQNTPPSIDLPVEICVIAGQLIDLTILGTDQDSFELLDMTALGGPFEQMTSPASFTQVASLGESRVAGRFVWQTTCEHISLESYKVVFKVTDAGTRPATTLATLKTLLIKVVGPPPQVQDIAFVDGSVRLTWELPYICQESGNFQGFSIWRRSGTKSIVIDTCLSGLEGQGYEKIVFITDEIEDGHYVHYDLDIDGADIWCYRVLAEFAKSTDNGNPFNKVTSLTSEERCVLSNRETALITNVSVVATDPVQGQIDIQWYMPKDEEIDKDRFPAPYKTSLLTAANGSGVGLAVIPASIQQQNRLDAFDTSFRALNINTFSTAHSYQVDIDYQGDRNLAESEPASSIFLRSRGNDERAELSWEFMVPWENVRYDIFEVLSNGDQIFKGTTDQAEFTVFDLVNGVQSCFLVVSEGKYNIAEIQDPLFNYSQISCVVPRDSLPPCTPDVVVSTVCDRNDLNADPVNTIRWSNNAICPSNADLTSYNLYFKDSTDAEVDILTRLSGDQFVYEHLRQDNIVGCYAISAVDSSGNESPLSAFTCVDNCPAFELPNTFTPNGDNANDLFVPRVARFVERIDFVVFNRWGQEVFRTTDPLINWDGRDEKGKELLAGTYYYQCQIFIRRVSGVSPSEDILTGSIQLIR